MIRIVLGIQCEATSVKDTSQRGETFGRRNSIVPAIRHTYGRKGVGNNHKVGRSLNIISNQPQHNLTTHDQERSDKAGVAHGEHFAESRQTCCKAS